MPATVPCTPISYWCLPELTAPRRWQALVVWLTISALIVIPIALAAFSPLLAWREPIYIVAGFAGIAGLAVLLLQPLLADGCLPGLPPRQTAHWHRWLGQCLIVAILLHVVGLYITSPPDVIDALLFRSPTPFSLWGVLALWAAITAATLVLLRQRLRWKPALWRGVHGGLTAIVVTGTVVHALLIQGTMEPWSKGVLCVAVIGVFGRVIWRRWAARLA